jgi:hypothetical protein
MGRVSVLIWAPPEKQGRAGVLSQSPCRAGRPGAPGLVGVFFPYCKPQLREFVSNGPIGHEIRKTPHALSVCLQVEARKPACFPLIAVPRNLPPLRIPDLGATPAAADSGRTLKA